MKMTEQKHMEERRYYRIETSVKVKLPGDLEWTESEHANVSGCGMLFDTARRLSTGDFIPLQFMLQGSTDKAGHVHFFASAKIVWIAPLKGYFRTAAELLVNDEVRTEILKILDVIKNRDLITTGQAPS